MRKRSSTCSPAEPMALPASACWCSAWATRACRWRAGSRGRAARARRRHARRAAARSSDFVAGELHRRAVQRRAARRRRSASASARASRSRSRSCRRRSRTASRSSATSSCSPGALPARRRAGARHHRHQRQEHGDRADRPSAARGRRRLRGRRQHRPAGARRAGATARGRTPARSVWVLELSSYQLETTWSLDAGRGGDAEPDARTTSTATPSMDDYARRQGAHLRGRRRAGAQPRRPALAWRMRAAPARRRSTFGLDAPRDAARTSALLEATASAGWRSGKRAHRSPVAELRARRRAQRRQRARRLRARRAVGLPLAPLLHGLRELPAACRTACSSSPSAAASTGTTTPRAPTSAPRSPRSTGLRASTAVLIAGGDGKGQDFSPLAAAVARTRARVLLIGRDAPLIEQALGAGGVPLERCATWRRRWRAPRSWRAPGDAVLLSPACASFDMFRDYRHRGEVFAAAVRCARMMASLAWRGRHVFADGSARRRPSTTARSPGRRCCCRARPGDGVFGVDRHRRGEPLHRQQRRPISCCATPCSSRVGAGAPRSRVFLVPVRFWQKAAPWLFVGWRGAAGAGAGSRHRARGERRAPLARPRRGEPAALGADEARGGALRRRLHGAQARGA